MSAEGNRHAPNVLAASMRIASPRAPRGRRSVPRKRDRTPPCRRAGLLQTASLRWRRRPPASPAAWQVASASARLRTPGLRTGASLCPSTSELLDNSSRPLRPLVTLADTAPTTPGPSLVPTALYPPPDQSNHDAAGPVSVCPLLLFPPQRGEASFREG